MVKLILYQSAKAATEFYLMNRASQWSIWSGLSKQASSLSIHPFKRLCQWSVEPEQEDFGLEAWREWSNWHCISLQTSTSFTFLISGTRSGIKVCLGRPTRTQGLG